MRSLLLPSLLAALLAAAPAAAQSPAARGASIAPPGCIDATGLVTQYDPAPVNVPYLRVQHMGDAGTDEQARQVANTVTWDVGQLSGLHAAPSAQRGYRDEAPPVGTTAFQLACREAGFNINTWQFSHRLPLVGEGPNITFGRDFDPPRPFAEGVALSVQARVPHLRNQRPPATLGTAQLNFVYYARDRVSRRVFAHVIGLFDNRPLGAGGAGTETFGDDGVTAFASSPLRATDATGAGVRFVSPPTAEEMHFAVPWSDLRLFRAVVTEANLRRLLAGLPREFSRDPRDYELLSFGVLAEVFPGTGDEDNLSFAGSLSDLALDAFRYPLRRNAPSP